MVRLIAIPRQVVNDQVLSAAVYQGVGLQCTTIEFAAVVLVSFLPAVEKVQFSARDRPCFYRRGEL
jgi:hypothetical protein